MPERRLCRGCRTPHFEDMSPFCCDCERVLLVAVYRAAKMLVDLPGGKRSPAYRTFALELASKVNDIRFPLGSASYDFASPEHDPDR